MSESLTYVLSGLAGLGLGALFFGGLWWTVRRGMASSRPALWFLGSLLCRTGLVLAGFYWVGHGNGGRLIACLVGFVIARFVIVRWTRPPAAPQPPTPEEPDATHA